MEFTLKNIKTLNTYDGQAFTASIYQDGKRVGTAENQGTGGQNIVHATSGKWKDSEQLMKELQAWLIANNAGHWTAEYNADPSFGECHAIDLLMERNEMAKQLAKHHKKQLVFRLPEDIAADEFRGFPRGKHSEHVLLEHLAKNFPTAEYWNGTRWCAVVREAVSA